MQCNHRPGSGRFACLVVLGAIVLGGCPASQSWTTARAVEPGRPQHTVGLEWLGVVVEQDCDPDVESCPEYLDGFFFYPFPAYAIRFGLSDRIDMAIKASMSGSMGFDLKLQLVRSEVFDFAIDPGYSFFGPFIGYLNLPLLASLNLGPTTTITLAPKASYIVPLQDDVDLVDGFFLGTGANLQIRVSDSFAITPGVDWSVFVTGGDAVEAVQYLSFGVGFSFGGMPDYGKADPEPPYGGQPPPAGPPAGPPPAPPPGYGAPPPGY